MDEDQAATLSLEAAEEQRLLHELSSTLTGSTPKYASGPRVCERVCALGEKNTLQIFRARATCRTYGHWQKKYATFAVAAHGVDTVTTKRVCDFLTKLYAAFVTKNGYGMSTAWFENGVSVSWCA